MVCGVRTPQTIQDSFEPLRAASGLTDAGATVRPMTRQARPTYQCDVCGHRPPKWVGRCPDCGEWGSLVEAAPQVPAGTAAARAVPARRPTEPARPMAMISAESARA